MAGNLHIDIEQEDPNRGVSGETRLGGSGIQHSTHINLDEKATPWERLGPQQVESLLAFVVSPSLERAMEHAEIEARVEDRVIRRKHGLAER